MARPFVRHAAKPRSTRSLNGCSGHRRRRVSATRAAAAAAAALDCLPAVTVIALPLQTTAASVRPSATGCTAGAMHR